MARATVLITLSLLLIAVVGGLAWFLPRVYGAQLPDPNAGSPARPPSAEVLLRNIGDTDRMLRQRMARGEIDEGTRSELLQQFAQSLVKDLDPERLPARDAWQYGDVYRDAGDWRTAYALYSLAVKDAKTEDRRVNDTLRLARAAAHLGREAEAIRLARSVFTAEPREKAPILPAVLYEIVPPLEASGDLKAVAALLADAVAQHMQVVVDANTPGGKAFLEARPIHVSRAWTKTARLYEEAGDDAAAREAVMKGDEMMAQFGRV